MKFTVEQAATIMGVSGTRIRILIAKKRLRAVKYGKCYEIDSQDLAAVERRKVGRPRKVRRIEG